MVYLAIYEKCMIAMAMIIILWKHPVSSSVSDVMPKVSVEQMLYKPFYTKY